MRREKGFTLIELMVTMSILSIVIAAIYGTFRGGVDAQQREKTYLLQTGRIVLEELSKDIRSAFIAPANKSLKFEGSKDRLSFVSTSCLSNNKIEPKRYDLCKIEYYITIDRRQKTEDRGQRTDTLCLMKREGETSYELTPLVKEIEFRYNNGHSWEGSWDSNKSLPSAVEITLTLEDSGLLETFSTVVDMP